MKPFRTHTHRQGPRPGGPKKCSMCGSKTWRIEWDPVHRAWFCVRIPTAEPAPKKARREKAAAPPEVEDRTPDIDPEAVPLRCDRCGQELVARALPGVSAYCSRCRRWAGDAG